VASLLKGHQSQQKYIMKPIIIILGFLIFFSVRGAVVRMGWYQKTWYMPQFAIAITRPPSMANAMPTTATTDASLLARDVPGSQRYRCRHLEDQTENEINRYVKYIYGISEVFADV
jgi:hypothetical protein